MLDRLHNLFVLPWHDAATLYWPIVVQGVMVSCALGLLGCFLVVRGLSLLGDALSHAVLPGIAIGFFVSSWLGAGSLHSPWILIGATAMGVAAAVLVELVQKQSRVKEDASLGIVFTTLFAVGVVLITRYAGQADLDPGCVLYGNIEHFVLNPAGVAPMAVVLGLVIAGIVAFYRPLLISTFDPGLAVSVGVWAAAVHYGLMTALSLTIVASFEAVGAILAVALLVTPGATARLWTHRLGTMLWFTAGFAVVSTVLGYWLSHPSVLDTSAGAAIAVAGFGLFLLSWLAAPGSGLINRWRTRRRLRQKIEVENLIKTIGESAVVGSAAPAEALARALNWTPARLAATAARGVRRGWVEWAPPGPPPGGAGALRLTPAGVERGRRLAEAHLAWEAYLRSQLGLPADHVHDAAEWIEHYLDDARLPAITPQ